MIVSLGNNRSLDVRLIKPTIHVPYIVIYFDEDSNRVAKLVLSKKEAKELGENLILLGAEE